MNQRLLLAQMQLEELFVRVLVSSLATTVIDTKVRFIQTLSSGILPQAERRYDIGDRCKLCIASFGRCVLNRESVCQAVTVNRYNRRAASVEKAKTTVDCIVTCIATHLSATVLECLQWVLLETCVRGQCFERLGSSLLLYKCDADLFSSPARPDSTGGWCCDHEVLPVGTLKKSMS